MHKNIDIGDLRISIHDYGVTIGYAPYNCLVELDSFEVEVLFTALKEQRRQSWTIKK